MKIIINVKGLSRKKVIHQEEVELKNKISTTKDLITELVKINEKGTTVLIVTHELDTLKYGKKVYTMSEGVLTEGRNL